MKSKGALTAVGLSIVVLLTFLIVPIPLAIGLLTAVTDQSRSGSQKCTPSVVLANDDSTEGLINVPAEYVDEVKKAAESSGIPAEILAKQIQQESGWNPKAVSPAGAKGLTQFMPATWEAVAPGEDPFDPIAAIAAQGRYMKQLKDQVENLANGDANLVIRLALAAYNAGLGNVLKYSGIPPFSETEHYIEIIIGGAQVQFSATCSQITGAVAWDGDLGDGEWTNPCPGCQKTSGFEPRNLAVDAQNHYVHWGLDLATPGAGRSPAGPIIAPANMKIVDIYDTDGCVFATATEGPKFGFSFCHLQSYDVAVGDSVERGTIIGIEGGTAGGVKNAFATHLHFEMYAPGFDITNFNWFNARTGWDNPGGNIDPEPILKAKGAW